MRPTLGEIVVGSEVPEMTPELIAPRGDGCAIGIILRPWLLRKGGQARGHGIDREALELRMTVRIGVRLPLAMHVHCRDRSIPPTAAAVCSTGASRVRRRAINTGQIG